MLNLLATFLVFAADPGKHTSESTSIDLPVLIITIVAVLTLLAGGLWFMARRG
jgi:hypothetical protein